MTSIPAGIQMNAALLRQNVALSVVKQNAEQAGKIVEILDKSVTQLDANSSRGSSINIKA